MPREMVKFGRNTATDFFAHGKIVIEANVPPLAENFEADGRLIIVQTMRVPVIVVGVAAPNPALA